MPPYCAEETNNVVVDGARQMMSSNLAKKEVGTAPQGKASGNVCNWRSISIRTLLYIVESYDIADETMRHAVLVLDRFIHAMVDKYPSLPFAALGKDRQSHQQLRCNSCCVAMVCLLISTKFCDMRTPLPRDLVELAGLPSGCSAWILRLEPFILQAVDWNIHFEQESDAADVVNK
eukprot:CAMPEP_0113698854 /NCGR_PEP_ID=MMETSP0038_2-20120614/22957_1 /TAXON_ID=2898 /ORGANISM="Cryptomonas paramecium" /LENGTH=175 /DNA_ID=CAMNT_0000622095 /DNA_START=33 /DNA_END=560 /DNA_ORIENTATION=- /assembly_acc=CAM_ASM_000170